jgi:putative flippase GtrA
MKLLTNSFYQLLRYGIVGLLLNITMYLVYLLITSFWLSPFQTVLILYPCGTVLGYLAHRKFTFQVSIEGFKGTTFLKYILLYVAGFFLNLLLLFFFHETLGYPHQLVQFMAIFVVAVFLFVSMKIFVFADAKNAKIGD